MNKQQQIGPTDKTLIFRFRAQLAGHAPGSRTVRIYLFIFFIKHINIRYRIPLISFTLQGQRVIFLWCPFAAVSHLLRSRLFRLGSSHSTSEYDTHEHASDLPIPPPAKHSNQQHVTNPITTEAATIRTCRVKKLTNCTP